MISNETNIEIKFEDGVPPIKIVVTKVKIARANDVNLMKKIRELIAKKSSELRKKYTIEEIKNDEVIRIYRDFYWKEVRIDPTKTRPASEALLRRIVAGKELPRISPVVDLLNIVSAESRIGFSAFDANMINIPFKVTMTKGSEEFQGIGMKKPKILEKGIVVTKDGKDRIINIYPYRDADFSKITHTTSVFYLLATGMKGIPDQTLMDATRELLKLYKQYLDAEYLEPRLFKNFI